MAADHLQTIRIKRWSKLVLLQDETEKGLFRGDWGSQSRRFSPFFWVLDVCSTTILLDQLTGETTISHQIGIQAVNQEFMGGYRDSLNSSR